MEPNGANDEMICTLCKAIKGNEKQVPNSILPLRAIKP